MKPGQPSADLARAAALSHEVLSAAEQADWPKVALLDAERMRLLKSFRQEEERCSSLDAELLQRIGALNDRTIGMLEHVRRRKGREMDLAAVGRRALAAYSSVRLRR